MSEIPSRYNPKDSEDRWYKLWEQENLFSAKPEHGKKPFCIVIPPPNVTGILHMGHALNNTIQDILIRYRRMRGESALWMPGIDHAGIATQNVVEKSIAREGKKRQDLGREEFISRVWSWKEEYGSTIIRQLKKLGASCDWGRLRFTMDDDYSKAVLEVFIRLYEKGLIYRGSYIINWCPRCSTALSDEEAPHKELQGSLYYIKYPLKDNPGEFITVATTRPETMLGDTAVAVNPKDKRYKKLVGRSLVLPLVNREIKVIADSMVDMKFGTGAVKVTPAHDPNDYALGKKHGLDFINLMHPDARMNESAGRYQGMDRFQAREAILSDLQEAGLLDKSEPHKLSAGHCYRCQTIIEPYLSKQWFVRMKPLARPALEAVKKGKIKFYPERWAKVYISWMENIQDWCISRQIWWGHRIPVYYCSACQKGEAGVIVARSRPDKCPVCGSSDICQDEDVLDTWFSSWLWPFATFRWPEKSQDLEYFYPTSALVTAPEIIFFWVARMIMAGFEFMGKEPFQDVYIHGTVRDIEGKKMSKSLGNIIDPLEIIAEYGADALRFSLISITSQGQDVFLSKERFEQGRNFANKVWNASRFILTNLEGGGEKKDLCLSAKEEKLGDINLWVLSRFFSVLKETEKDISLYRFNEAANALYAFFWHEFCDWYLEVIKADIRNPHNQLVMYKVLEKFLRALHPFMPFVTEEVWQRLDPRGGFIMVSAWPHAQAQFIDKRLEKRMRSLFELITQIRNLRGSIDIKPEQEVEVSLYAHGKEKEALIREHSGLIIRLSRLSGIHMLEKGQRPKDSVSAVAEDTDIYLHFTGLLDINKEQRRIQDKCAQLLKAKDAKESRLKNKDFIRNAPADIVEKERQGIEDISQTLGRLKKMQEELNGAR